MGSGSVDWILLEHMTCVSFVHHIIFSNSTVLHTLLATSHKTSFVREFLSALILFANSESSESFSSGFTSGGDAPTGTCHGNFGMMILAMTGLVDLLFDGVFVGM